MLRLLMLDNEFPPLGGGTAVVNFHILEELAKYPDVWVDLVTATPDHNRQITERFAARINLYKVAVGNRDPHHATNAELIRFAGRGLWASWALQREQQYSASFAFAGVPAGAIKGDVLKRTVGLPYLVSLQGADVPGFETRYDYLYPWLKPGLKEIWRRADAVTAISQDLKELAQATLPTLPVTMIPNGVDTQVFRPPAQARQAAEVVILCVGRLIERKGQQYLLQAFAQLRAAGHQAIRLILAGSGDSERALKALAEQLAISDRVTFTGAVSREAMPGLFQQADIFVLPSQQEGMSIAVLEALATGLPVVLTAWNGVGELAAEAVEGLLTPWAEVAPLAAALERLILDRELRMQMGAASRARAMRHSWPAITRTYLDLCEKIAVRPTPQNVNIQAQTEGLPEGD